MASISYDPNTPEGRQIEAAAGVNTLGGASSGSMLPGVQVSMGGGGGGFTGDPTKDLDQADVLAQYKEQSGFKRDELAANVKQAKQTLDFQYANMRQQAKTAQDRLAVDQWYQQQQVRLADQTHALAVRAEGASEAKTMTDYLSGPDQMFQARQLGNSLYALNNGQAAPAYRAGGDMEQPRSVAGYYALPGNSQAGAAQTQAGAGSGGGGTSTPSAAPDGRINAATAIMKALPPSNTPGMGQADNAAMNAVASLYGAPNPSSDAYDGPDLAYADQQGSKFLSNGPGNVALGTYQSLLPGTQAALGSLAKTKGINYQDWQAQWARNQPGQGSASGA